MRENNGYETKNSPLVKDLIRAYYGTLSLTDILQLQTIYQEDFNLFGYKPSYIFRLLSHNWGRKLGK